MVKKYSLIIFILITLPLFLFLGSLYINQKKSVEGLVEFATQNALNACIQRVVANVESELKGLQLFANSRYASTALFFDERSGLKQILLNHIKTQKGIDNIFIIRKDGSLFSFASVKAIPNSENKITFTDILKSKNIDKFSSNATSYLLLEAGEIGPFGEPVQVQTLFTFVQVYDDTNAHLGYIVDMQTADEFIRSFDEVLTEFKEKGLIIKPELKLRAPHRGYLKNEPEMSRCQSTLFNKFSRPLQIELCIRTDADKLIEVFFPTRNSILFWVMIAIAISAISGIFIARYISRPIRILAEQIKRYQSGKKPIQSVYVPQEAEIKVLFDAFYELVNTSEAAKLREVETARKEALYNLSSQVAHDIRSPVAVLQTLTHSIVGRLNDQERVLVVGAISRILSVSDSLLRNRKMISNSDGCYLVIELFQLLEEKKIESANAKKIEINLNVSSDCYDAYISMNPAELKRAFSNLINNAIDALSDFGKINVFVFIENGSCFALIQDTGVGMSEDTLKKIGMPGFTLGKNSNSNSGTGLGFHSSKSILESNGHKIEITSKIGVGTKVKVIFVTSLAPKPLIPLIALRPNTDIYVLDDDITVHQMWESYLKKYHQSSSFKLHCFSTFDELASNLPIGSNCFCAMIDYRLNSQLNGLQVIKKLNIEERSVLVTHDYLDPRIQDDCKNSGVTILPKPFLYMNPNFLGVNA
jgi:signal transduction histidine kinase